MDIHRLHRIAGLEMDAVEILGEFDQVREGFEVAGLTPLVEIGIVRRRSDLSKDRAVAADLNDFFRIARGDREPLGTGRDFLHHEITAHAHRHTVRLDRAALALEDSDRVFVQKLNADFFENTHRGIVNLFDALLCQRLNRVVEIFRQMPRRLANRRAAPARITGTASGSAAAGSGGVGGGLGHDDFPFLPASPRHGDTAKASAFPTFPVVFILPVQSILKQRSSEMLISVNEIIEISMNL